MSSYHIDLPSERLWGHRREACVEWYVCIGILWRFGLLWKALARLHFGPYRTSSGGQSCTLWWAADDCGSSIHTTVPRLERRGQVWIGKLGGSESERWDGDAEEGQGHPPQQVSQELWSGEGWGVHTILPSQGAGADSLREKVWRSGSQGAVVLRTAQKPARRRLAVQGRRGGRCKFQGREREQTQSRGASCTCSPRPCWGTSPSGTQW